MIRTIRINQAFLLRQDEHLFFLAPRTLHNPPPASVYARPTPAWVPYDQRTPRGQKALINRLRAMDPNASGEDLLWRANNPPMDKRGEFRKPRYILPRIGHLAPTTAIFLHHYGLPPTAAPLLQGLRPRCAACIPHPSDPRDVRHCVDPLHHHPRNPDFWRITGLPDPYPEETAQLSPAPTPASHAPSVIEDLLSTIHTTFVGENILPTSSADDLISAILDYLGEDAPEVTSQTLIEMFTEAAARPEQFFEDDWKVWCDLVLNRKD